MPPGELALLRARVTELAAENLRLREAAGVRDELAAQLAAAQAQLAARDAQLQALASQMEELERRLSKDSSTSSRPPRPSGQCRLEVIPIALACSTAIFEAPPCRR